MSYEREFEYESFGGEYIIVQYEFSYSPFSENPLTLEGWTLYNEQDEEIDTKSLHKRDPARIMQCILDDMEYEYDNVHNFHADYELSMEDKYYDT